MVTFSTESSLSRTRDSSVGAKYAIAAESVEILPASNGSGDPYDTGGAGAGCDGDDGGPPQPRRTTSNSSVFQVAIKRIGGREGIIGYRH